MGAMGMVGGILGMVTGIAGNNIQQMAGIEGAKLGSHIQQQALAFQDEILNDQIARLKPYWEQGKSAVEGLRQLDADYGGALATYNQDGNLVDESGEDAEMPTNTRAAIDAATSFLEGEGEKRGGFGNTVRNRLAKNAQIQGRENERRKLGDYVNVGMGAADQSGALTPDQSGNIMQIGLSRAGAEQRFATGTQNTISRAVDTASGIPAYTMADRYNKNNKLDPMTEQSRKYGGF